jgi:hypothetical protein
MTCVFCDHQLDDIRTRPAFDPWLGRLWRVCPECRRWNVAPLEERWETMEELERSSRDAGRALLRTEHLDLVDTGAGQLIRVGRAPRPELAGWRYGDVLPQRRVPGILAWLRRLVLGLPSSAFGYNAGHGLGMFEPVSSGYWFASPFIDDAPTLTAAFLHVPLAESCPACGGPMALAPWRFQGLRLTTVGGELAMVASCALCEQEVAVPAVEGRPALRLGLAIVNRRLVAEPMVAEAAQYLDRADGPAGFLHRLGRTEVTLGEIPARDRLALGMALDEQSEAELLESEWREAEELAGIADGLLTEVPGFDEFRRRVLGSGDG